MVKHSLKILQEMLQDFESLFDHFIDIGVTGLTRKIFFSRIEH